MNKLFHPALIGALLLFQCLTSCKDDDPETGSCNEFDVKVVDFATGQPIEGASISISVLEDLTPASGGFAAYGTSDAQGHACIEMGGYDYVGTCGVTKSGYEQYCYIFNPPTTLKDFETNLLMPDCFINVHLVNDPPVHINDSLVISTSHYHLGDFCSGSRELNFIGPNMDTVVNMQAVNGQTGFAWILYRNHVHIADSSFSISINAGDTAFLDITY